MKSDNLEKQINNLADRAKEASFLLLNTSQEKVDKCLITISELLDSKKEQILEANKKDIKLAKEKKLSQPMIERLTLSDKAFNSMKEGLKIVAGLPSPVGSIFDERKRPNGLNIYKMRVPIGVIAIIYESRPNVTIDAASLCLKSRNSVILRGGSEAFLTNKALANIICEACKICELPVNSVQLIPTTERRAIDLLLKKEDKIDLVIPRGGEGLIKTVVEKSHIPVIKHYKGVCHVFVSRYADMNKAIPIVINAKTQRPAVCNAMETLLIDKELSYENKKKIIDELLNNNVTIFGDKEIKKFSSLIKPATKEDWYAEYLDLRLAVKTLNGIEEAIEHINTYGSHHTDAIVTESQEEAEKFLQLVDSSSVMINASTRFSDGGEYGMGAEIGISTDKLHARGPMGITELTTYKWIVKGNGQIRT
jgi:glutamate-5-semialdehyde dehydrogenase